MTKKELLQKLSDKKIPDSTEVKILCNRAQPISIETAYYDKPDNRIIIETN